MCQCGAGTTDQGLKEHLRQSPSAAPWATDLGPQYCCSDASQWLSGTQTETCASAVPWTGHSAKALKSLYLVSSMTFLCNPVYARRVDFSDLVFSLSSHRHSSIGLVCSSRLGLLVDSEIVLSTRYGKVMVFIRKTLSTETSYQQDLINRDLLSTRLIVGKVGSGMWCGKFVYDSW